MPVRVCEFNHVMQQVLVCVCVCVYVRDRIIEVLMLYFNCLFLEVGGVGKREWGREKRSGRRGGGGGWKNVECMF